MISTFALFLCLENKRVKDTKERRRILLTITDYVKAKTLEEAYELNQARNSRVMGGMMVELSWKCESKDSNRSVRAWS